MDIYKSNVIPLFANAPEPTPPAGGQAHDEVIVAAEQAAGSAYADTLRQTLHHTYDEKLPDGGFDFDPQDQAAMEAAVGAYATKQLINEITQHAVVVRSINTRQPGLLRRLTTE